MQRRILSLDRTSSINSLGRAPIRDSSAKMIHHSKQKLRRKGSGGLPDFQALNTQRMKKQIYNTVLDRNQDSSNLKNMKKQGTLLSPKAKVELKDKKFGKVQITNINVKASAKDNLQRILGAENNMPTPLHLQQQYSSSNTADHYEDRYLNANINTY